MVGNLIPLTVIGGFLGSGKTTLVNRVLGGLTGVHTTVLVNDFGLVNIDARLISKAGGETISLTNGCVCCSIGSDLTDALIRVIEAQPPPEWIIIEASGVSDPWKIAQVGMADPALLLDGVVVLADAQSVQEYAADSRLVDTILRQLRSADILILNKADLVTREALRTTHKWLKAQVPNAWIHETNQADVPFELLSSLAITPHEPTYRHVPSRPALMALDETHDHMDHAHAFATWSFETKSIFSAKKLSALLDNMPPNVIRAKGIVCTDASPDQTSVFQFAAKSRMLKPFGPRTGSVSQIVFISSLPDATFATTQARLEEALL